MTMAPWMAEAMKEHDKGIQETKGAQHNKAILGYWKEAGIKGVSDDETPWCAAFVNAMLARAKIPGTGKANAKSFIGWGTKLDKPVPGCIVVLDRPPVAWQGHVGFFVSADPHRDTVTLLGGNQGDRVSIASFKASRVNSYWWPKGFTLTNNAFDPKSIKGVLDNPSDR